jgi:hypothetical protein
VGRRGFVRLRRTPFPTAGVGYGASWGFVGYRFPLPGLGPVLVPVLGTVLVPVLGTVLVPVLGTVWVPCVFHVGAEFWGYVLELRGAS